MNTTQATDPSTDPGILAILTAEDRPHKRTKTPRLEVGDRVRVVAWSGIDAGRAGVVVNPSTIPTDGRGIPTIGEGHYKPVDYRRECAVREDSGRLFTMFRNRLERAD